MPHPKWLSELDKSLNPEQQALLSTDLRAALAKATVETTDDKTTLGITQEIAVVALTELIPVALMNKRSWINREVIVALTTHIERWKQTRRTTPANTNLVQALRAEAAHWQTDPIGQSLWAAARLLCLSYPVSYQNPRSRDAPIRIGKMANVTADFLTVCLAARGYDRVCVERGINTVIEVINEKF